MKTHYLLLLLAVFVFTACSKDATTANPTSPSNPPNPTNSTYVISEDSFYYSAPGNTEVREFLYDSSKQLVKVEYKFGVSATYSSYDTMYYDDNGRVSEVLSHNNNLGDTLANYYYSTGGQLDSMIESGTNDSGTYTRTRLFLYNNNMLDSMGLVYHHGNYSPVYDGPEKIGSITYSGNNIASAVIYDLFFHGTLYDDIPVTFTIDSTAPNPYYNLIFNTSRNYSVGGSNSIFNLFSQNNIIAIGPTIAPSTFFYNASFMYANGRVASYMYLAGGTTFVSYIALQ